MKEIEFEPHFDEIALKSYNAKRQAELRALSLKSRKSGAEKAEKLANTLSNESYILITMDKHNLKILINLKNINNNGCHVNIEGFINFINLQKSTVTSWKELKLHYHICTISKSMKIYSLSQKEYDSVSEKIRTIRYNLEILDNELT